MVKIENVEIRKRLAESTKISPQTDLPEQLGNIVVPVISAEPKVEMKVLYGNAIDSASTTLLTTSAKKETYISGILLTISKDAGNLGGLSYVQGFIKNNTDASRFNIIRYEPSTAGQFISYVPFPNPVLMKKGSIVALKNDSAVASIDATAIIYYHEVDPQ